MSRFAFDHRARSSRRVPTTEELLRPWRGKPEEAPGAGFDDRIVAHARAEIVDNLRQKKGNHPIIDIVINSRSTFRGLVKPVFLNAMDARDITTFLRLVLLRLHEVLMTKTQEWLTQNPVLSSTLRDLGERRFQETFYDGHPRNILPFGIGFSTALRQIGSFLDASQKNYQRQYGSDPSLPVVKKIYGNTIRKVMPLFTKGFDQNRFATLNELLLPLSRYRDAKPNMVFMNADAFLITHTEKDRPDDLDTLETDLRSEALERLVDPKELLPFLSVLKEGVDIQTVADAVSATYPILRVDGEEPQCPGHGAATLILAQTVWEVCCIMGGHIRLRYPEAQTNIPWVLEEDPNPTGALFQNTP